MVDAEGKRICDKEYWSRLYKMWCGCRKPAVVNVPSKYVTSGLDYCHKHLPETIKQPCTSKPFAVED